MAGTKRPLKPATSNGNKRAKVSADSNPKVGKALQKQKPKSITPESPESTDFSDSEDDLDDQPDLSDPSDDNENEEDAIPAKKIKFEPKANDRSTNGVVKTQESGVVNGEGFLKASGSTSREAHAKQKQLALERKASKPNADLVARSKKLWEKLRRKSHVPKDERKKLVAELFEIITGRVHDFVFKHDSVRVIQTALKYANPSQRKQIAQELKGEYKVLAESRYGKFLVGKLMVHGDQETRDFVIKEFYGSVKRLIRHPEASWIVDDIYRTLATQDQKAVLLREWYGPEFVVFRQGQDKNPTADLSEILEAQPEKRGPIMKHLHELTNQLVQKKTTGFTMLHDAMLQYFINLKPGTAEFNESIQMLLDDEEGDCLKNLAFTKSGSRLVCLTLAYASAKDRKLILRHYKSTVKMLAADQYGHMVLLTAFDVIDDTVMTSKSIMPELLSKDINEQSSRDEELLARSLDLTSRIPLLYLFNSSDSQPKWLLQLQPHDQSILSEVHAIRSTTSKKDSETRRLELLKSFAQPLLDLIASQASELVHSIPGTQFTSEVLLGTVSPSLETDNSVALQSILSLATTLTTPGETSETDSAANNPSSSPSFPRLLKVLVQSGKYSPTTKSIVPTTPPLDFAEPLFDSLLESDQIVEWATTSQHPSLAFVIVAMVEMGDRLSDGRQSKLRAVLTKKEAKKRIRDAATSPAAAAAAGKKKAKTEDSVSPPEKGNAGAKILVELLKL